MNKYEFISKVIIEADSEYDAKEEFADSHAWDFAANAKCNKINNVQSDEPLEFQDSKTLLVDANRDDAYFFAWELKDDSVISIEIQPLDYPSKSMCHYNSIKEFIENTEWHEWIIEGINNEEIQKKVEI